MYSCYIAKFLCALFNHYSMFSLYCFQDLLTGYNCSCLSGFTGTNCDQEEGGDSDDAIQNGKVLPHFFICGLRNVSVAKEVCIS